MPDARHLGSPLPSTCLPVSLGSPAPSFMLLGLSKILQHLYRYRDDIGLAPGRRDPECTEWKLHRLCEKIADDGDDLSAAIEHRRPRGSMIEDEAIVPIVHLKQRGAPKTLAIPVLHETT